VTSSVDLGAVCAERECQDEDTDADSRSDEATEAEVEAGGSDVVDVVTAEARVGCDALAAVQAHRHVGLLAVLVHDVALGSGAFWSLPSGCTGAIWTSSVAFLTRNSSAFKVATVSAGMLTRVAPKTELALTGVSHRKSTHKSSEEDKKGLHFPVAESSG